MNTPITRAEHAEFVRRMEDEHERINARLKDTEKVIEQNNKLLTSVEKLALSMETMQKELKSQGERLVNLESRDGEMWRKVVGHVITATISIIVGFVFAQIGM